MITVLKVFVKFQTSNPSMLVGMPWLWSCWLDRSCTTWEFQVEILGRWSIWLVFSKLDPFSLNHFSDPIYACITKSSILIHLAFVTFLNQIGKRKIEILTSWPFLKGQKCLIQICTIFTTVSLSLIYTFILVALLKICLDVVWLRFIWLDQLPFWVITHIWRSQFICFQTYSTILPSAPKI